MPFLTPNRTKRLKPPPSRARKTVFRVIGVLVVLVLIELATRGCIDSVASRSIESNTVGVQNVNVASGDIPTVFYYGVLGELRNGSITMHDIVATPVNIASLSVTAEALELSRSALITGKAQVTGSPPYRTTVYLSPKNLGDSLNATVTFQSNHLVATIDTHNMNVVPKLVNRRIVLSDGRYTFSVPLPGLAYLPCKPDTFGVSNGIWVACNSQKLPPIVAHATK